MHTSKRMTIAYLAMAAALRAQAPAIVVANGEDMEAARAAGTTEALLDRLMLELESVLRDELNLMNNQEKGGEADE